MFLFNFSVFVYYRYCISQSSSAILLKYDTCCCFHHHIKLSVELFHTASELFFFIQQLTAQCSVSWNHSLLIISAHRWFIQFAHFKYYISLWVHGPVRPKTLTIILVPWTVYGCVCGVSINQWALPWSSFQTWISLFNLIQTRPIVPS